jgi:hypothetical protein
VLIREFVKSLSMRVVYVLRRRTLVVVVKCPFIWFVDARLRHVRIGLDSRVEIMFIFTHVYPFPNAYASDNR